MVLRPVVVGIVFLLTVFAGPADHRETISGSDQSPEIAWSFCTSPSPVGLLGNLVGLDSAAPSGFMVVEPGRLNLRSVERDSSGAIRFVSEVFAEREYRFSGTSTDSGFEGTLETVVKGAVVSKSSLTCWRVVRRVPERRSVVPIRASSAAFNAEAGDRTGADVELFDTSVGPRGLMLLNGQNWGEPRTWLALDDIREAADRVEFSASIAAKTVGYELRVGGRRAVLHRVGSSADNDEAMQMLADSLMNTGR